MGLTKTEPEVTCIFGAYKVNLAFSGFRLDKKKNAIKNIAGL